MEFEWDEAKNRANFLKHGVDFSIMESFDWDRASLRIDNRRDYGEERIMAYGPAGDGHCTSQSSPCAAVYAGSLQCAALDERTTCSMNRPNLPDERLYGTPDEDSPELTAETAKQLVPAKQFFAERGLPMPGRPKAASTKVSVSLRLDPEVVDGFKADGPGWQTRMNAVLAASLKQGKKSA